MNGAQPVHKRTGQLGPVCPCATAACFWIFFQEDSHLWTWVPTPPSDTPATIADIFTPAAA